MSLSITSATSALATLQSLALQDASGPQGPAGAASPAAPTSSVKDAAVQPGSGGGGAIGPYLVADAGAQALSAADAAAAAGRTVLGLLQEMQDAASQASRPDLSPDDRAGLAAAFAAAAGRIEPALAGAGVGGANLVDGSMSSGLKAPLGGGATASLSPADLSLGGSLIASPPGVATATAAASSFAGLGDAIAAASGALGRLQSQADQLTAHAGFVQQLGQALASPADDGGDSVRLLALQVSQQLAAQPAAVANASPQSVLSLFRS